MANVPYALQIERGIAELDGVTLTGIVVTDAYELDLDHSSAASVVAAESTAEGYTRLTATASSERIEGEWVLFVEVDGPTDLSDEPARGGVVWVAPGSSDAARRTVFFHPDPGGEDPAYQPTYDDGAFSLLIESVERRLVPDPLGPDQLEPGMYARVKPDRTGWEGVAVVAESAAVTTLTDVDLITTPPEPGQALVWDPDLGGAGKWRPGSVATPSSSGGLVMSHDWRSYPDGAVASTATANGEGTLGAADWIDVHDVAPGFVQDAHVVDGAMRLRAVSPVNMVGGWTITGYAATADVIRAGFLHAGFLDAAVESECDAHASMNIVLVDDAGSGYVCHFLNVYEGGSLVGKVLIGRDTAGVFTEDDEVVLDRPLRAGDRCEFSVDRGSPNNLRAFLNGDEVAAITSTSHDLRDFTTYSLPTNSQTTGIKWRPGYSVQWVTTGGAWVPEVGWAEGGGAVGSVNGQTGTVVLDAADVGAPEALQDASGLWIGTQAQYDAIETPSDDVLYIVREV